MVDLFFLLGGINREVGEPRFVALSHSRVFYYISVTLPFFGGNWAWAEWAKFQPTWGNYLPIFKGKTTALPLPNFCHTHANLTFFKKKKNDRFGFSSPLRFESGEERGGSDSSWKYVAPAFLKSRRQKVLRRRQPLFSALKRKEENKQK